VACIDMDDRGKSCCPTVLCIDDNWEVLKLEKLILEAAGYTVLLASDGADGINLAKRCSIDLVVLDHEMPRMTGTEVAEHLRSIQPSLPIIMVSGLGFREGSSRTVNCFIPKPKMVMSLVREVNLLLDNKRRGDVNSRAGSSKSGD